MMAFASLRIRLALLIAPELLRPIDVVADAVARTAELPEISPLTEQVIRLGELWLAHAGTRNFRVACGLPELGEVVEGARHGTRRTTRAQNEAACMQTRWRAICANPHHKMRPLTNYQHRAFFADHWPTDLPWPADIPRPVLQREAA